MSEPVNLKDPSAKPVYDNTKLVTVMTDASFCPDTGAAGWGVYIRNQKRLFEKGGNFRENPKCSFEAELMGIALGAIYAMKEGLGQEGYHLLIQTDCKMAIQALGGQNHVFDKSSYHLVDRVRKTFRDLKTKYNITWQFRHVKAHVPERAPRNWANDRCDQLARKFMREQRFIIRSQQGKAASEERMDRVEP